MLCAACGGDDELVGAPAGDGGKTITSGEAGADAGSDSASTSDAALGQTYSGEVTYYDANGTGACGFKASTDFMVVAMNDEQFKRSMCGECISVTGPNGTVVVRITDVCPGCGTGDLDLSQTAFSRVAKLSAGRVKVDWHFVTCP